MRKLFSFMFGAIFALTIFGFAFSDSVLDYLDDIGGDILFGYGSSDQISVDNIDENSVLIESPVLVDEFDDIINDYTLMYGEYPLIDVLDDPTLLDYSMEKSFENLDLDGDSNFTMELTKNDDLDEDKIYYVVSVPRDEAGSLGEISNEICFRLVDQVYGEGDECENTDVSASTHSAGADMSLANVSHTINGDRVTLRWISLDGSDEIDIFLRDEDAGTFNKLSTVDMDSESYSFDIDDNGEHIVKFIPSNGGVEKNYTFNAMGIEDTDDPTPVVTPVVVGPKENIIAILIGTILIYLIYRVAKSRKRA
ncbi:MAG TPA: hypothetical protein VJ892_03605 [Candidatus Absconditabacterales bacterium]|nr:hypothetical protein [Candidatus Absconditabacterales bacterium]